MDVSTTLKGFKVSSTVSSQTVTGSTHTTVFTLSFKATGRPIVVELEPGPGLQGDLYAQNNDGDARVQFEIKLLRDSTEVASQMFQVGDEYISINPSAVRFNDTPSEGTYTYKIQVATGNTSGTEDHVKVTNTRMRISEL